MPRNRSVAPPCSKNSIQSQKGCTAPQVYSSHALTKNTPTQHQSLEPRHAAGGVQSLTLRQVGKPVKAPTHPHICRFSSQWPSSHPRVVYIAISCAMPRASSNKDHDFCVWSPPNPKQGPQTTSQLQLTGAALQSADARRVLSKRLSTNLARSYSPAGSSAGHGAFRYFAAEGT